MKTTKKLLSIILSLTFILGITAIQASANNADSYFDVENGVLTKYVGTDSALDLSDMGITEIGSEVFMNNITLKSVIIPGTVSKIDDLAFWQCSKLTSATISSGVTTIGDRAFCFCHSLVSVSIPSTVSYIGGSAFAGTALPSVTIPASVAAMGAEAFSDCRSLTDITFCGNTKFDSLNVFDGCAYLQSVSGIIGSDAQKEALADHIKFIGIAADPNQSSNSTAQYVVPNTSAVTVNGKSVAFQAYTINGNNYFKLRDLAMALNGSGKQFNVGWDGTNNAISITSNSAYIPVGGELTNSGDSSTVSATLSTAKVYLDGKQVSLTAYLIGSNNYFKLRDVGQALNFGVIWDGNVKMIKIDTSTGYTA